MFFASMHAIEETVEGMLTAEEYVRCTRGR